MVGQKTRKLCPHGFCMTPWLKGEMKLRVALPWLGSYYKGQTFSVLGVGKFLDDAMPSFVAFTKKIDVLAFQWCIICSNILHGT